MISIQKFSFVFSLLLTVLGCAFTLWTLDVIKRLWLFGNNAVIKRICPKGTRSVASLVFGCMDFEFILYVLKVNND